jgi:hypothetical protein
MFSRSPLDRNKRRMGGGMATGKSGGGRRAPADCRVFVSNIPFDMKWQDLKVLELFFKFYFIFILVANDFISPFRTQCLLSRFIHHSTAMFP